MLAALITTRVQILTVALPNGNVGVPYSFLLLGGGGGLPYTWSVLSGSLPPGLALTPTTGLISGVPTVAGTFVFTIQLMDSGGAIATKIFTIVIGAVQYVNQTIAATTTFTCISIAKTAAAISTNPLLSYQISFSTPGNESLVSQLNRLYDSLLSANASNDPQYLSATIVQVLAVVFSLNSIVQVLPASPVNVATLRDIQTRLAIAYRLLLSLVAPSTPIPT